MSISPKHAQLNASPRTYLAAALLLCGLGIVACGPTVSIPKDSVAVGSARVLTMPGGDAANRLANRIIVAHASDGWHVFLAWRPQAGNGCLDKLDRTLIVSRLPRESVDQIRHPCSGTAWNLDGNYLSGPSSGPADQHLVALSFQETASSIVVYLAGQDGWHVVSSTTPNQRTARNRAYLEGPSAGSTPLPAPTPTRIR